MTRHLSLAYATCGVQLLPFFAGTYAVGDSKYWISGESVRDLDTACGWPTPPSNCSVSLDMKQLRVGGVVVVDDFLNDDELKLLRGIVEQATSDTDQRYSPKHEERLGTSFISIKRLADEPEEHAMLALLRRIQGNAVRTIHSLSDFKEGPWAYRGSFFPDSWSIRRYHKMGQPASNRLDVHLDTGSYARCLSAVLFFGTEIRGGSFRTHRCKRKRRKCRGIYGYQHDRRLPAIEDVLLESSNLETLAEVPYKTGRLVFFLSETLHDVAETVEGNRDVLFMWFGCEPCLLNSISDNGHMALVEFLVEQRADVTQVNPSTGEGAIHHAALAGHVALSKFLISKDPDAVHRRLNKQRAPPLHMAAAMGHIAVAKVLLSLSADVAATDANGKTAEDHAWKYAPRGVDAEVADLLKTWARGSKDSSEL